MRILHTIGSVRSDAGGPSRSVQGLVAALDRICEVDVCLLIFKINEKPWLNGVTRFRTTNRNGYRGALEAVESAVREFQPDIIHLHGIWAPSVHAGALYARRQSIPYIISPRGMLEPWSLSKNSLKKKLALWAYQRRDLTCAAQLHATADSEAEQFRNLGFTQPIFVCPNGINTPTVMPPRLLHSDGHHRAVFLSRIHPKKGLSVLIEAWALIRPSGWILEIAGSDSDGHQKIIEGMVVDYGIEDSVVFTGYHNDERKWEVYRRADLFVLPTYSENFGIVVPEALYANVPVITTKGTPWESLLGVEAADSGIRNRGSKSGRCGWWIETGVLPLCDALCEATSLSNQQRYVMGRNGRSLVEKKYLWDSVASCTLQMYKEIYSRK